MSYNIDSIDIVSAKDFKISEERLQTMCERLEASEEIPESNFFDQINEHDRHQNIDRDDTHWLVSEGCFWWGSEGSGRCQEGLAALLGCFTGHADLIVCWEGGDSYTGCAGPPGLRAAAETAGDCRQDHARLQPRAWAETDGGGAGRHAARRGALMKAKPKPHRHYWPKPTVKRPWRRGQVCKCGAVRPWVDTVRQYATEGWTRG